MFVLNGVSHPRSTSRSYLLRSTLPAVYFRPPPATIRRSSLMSSSCTIVTFLESPGSTRRRSVQAQRCPSLPRQDVVRVETKEEFRRLMLQLKPDQLPALVEILRRQFDNGGSAASSAGADRIESGTGNGWPAIAEGWGGNRISTPQYSRHCGLITAPNESNIICPPTFSAPAGLLLLSLPALATPPIIPAIA